MFYFFTFFEVWFNFPAHKDSIQSQWFVKVNKMKSKTMSHHWVMLVWMHRIGLPDLKLLLKTLFHSYRYLLPSRWDTVHRRRNVFFIESTLIDTLIEVCHSLPSFQELWGAASCGARQLPALSITLVIYCIVLNFRLFGVRRSVPSIAPSVPPLWPARKMKFLTRELQRPPHMASNVRSQAESSSEYYKPLNQGSVSLWRSRK